MHCYFTYLQLFFPIISQQKKEYARAYTCAGNFPCSLSLSHSVICKTINKKEKDDDPTKIISLMNKLRKGFWISNCCSELTHSDGQEDLKYVPSFWHSGAVSPFC